jgi:hypothetical protein
LLRQDGASFSASVTTALILGPDKQPKALMSVARDVSHLSVVAPEAPVRKRSGTLEEAVATALKASPTLLDTIPHVLQTLCTDGAWDAGVFWNVDSTHQVLRCRTVWHEHSLDFHGFEALCRQLTIAPGIDLPGRVWNLRSPVWITDITSDAAMLRALMASKEGLQSALCFPVVTGGAVHGIFEFFSRASRPVDHQVMETMIAVNAQIGSFLERKEAEKLWNIRRCMTPSPTFPIGSCSRNGCNGHWGGTRKQDDTRGLPDRSRPLQAGQRHTGPGTGRPAAETGRRPIAGLTA